jgi:hypothetical protein
LVISFSRIKGLRKVSAGMICSILISLEQNCTSRDKRGISG